MTEKPVALITGSSGGLGSAKSRALAADGFDLVLMSRSGCAEIAAETGGTGVAGSVLNDSDIEQAVRTAINTCGCLDAAVFGARRHSEVMKGFDLPKPPAATKDSFSFDPVYTRDTFDIPLEAWRRLRDDGDRTNAIASYVLAPPLGLTSGRLKRFGFHLRPIRQSLKSFQHWTGS